MTVSKFSDCVWYSVPQRAGGRALEMSTKSAEPMFVVKDRKSKMFGVGTGSTLPGWAHDESEFELVCIIHPRVH